ncbi:TetR/AcrR family transcriptional regulator C-terminal domain-containing protein [Cryptosporangium minutisporangium]|uniref:TetR/AcrR family transcriptional regulator C-terminal domain-containing protein n=1 Tax=Cryptosporangium minutisporangium TaxID=113569 RepID=A0ABP6SSV9_9ACTN
MSVTTQLQPRTPLSRERVLRAAVEIADAEGAEALTMRRLAKALGAEAMSLYHYVANKEDLLDGVVELIASEINDAVDQLGVPSAGAAWKQATRLRILTARTIFLRHPWAPHVFETRKTVSLAVVRYHDRLVGLMRDGGFSYDLAHHALHALGSRALGFSQELFDPGDGAAAGSVPAELAEQVPHLVGMLTEVAHDDPDSTLGWCDDQFEFEFGLDLILDGLDRLRTAAR